MNIKKFIAGLEDWLTNLFCLKKTEEPTEQAQKSRKKKKKKKKQVSPVQVDHMDYQRNVLKDFMFDDKGKRYTKPFLFTGKFVSMHHKSDEENKVRPFFTFANIKMFVPGFETVTLIDHISIFKIDAFVQGVELSESKIGEYFLLECKPYRYCSYPDGVKTERYGLKLVDYIHDIKPIYSLKNEFVVNYISQKYYINCHAVKKLKKYIGNKIRDDGFRYEDTAR